MPKHRDGEPVPKQKAPVKSRAQERRERSGNAPDVPLLDLEAVLPQVLQFIEGCPRGASRKDILGILGLHKSALPRLIECLEGTGLIEVIGRGPGLRYTHAASRGERLDEQRKLTPSATRSQELREAASVLRAFLQAHDDEVDSARCQEVTGLPVEPVRYLLRALIKEGVVARSEGNTQSVRYRWIGQPN